MLSQKARNHILNSVNYHTIIAWLCKLGFDARQDFFEYSGPGYRCSWVITGQAKFTLEPFPGPGTVVLHVYM